MSRRDLGTNDEKELEDKLARLERAIWGQVWLLGAICVATLGGLVWILIREGAVDAEIVAASLGGG